MAGESARELARRQREKAERLTRSAALWERGAEGEEAVAAALAQLPSEAWTVFHDVRWPGRRYANVDHIVVGPPGVFVIDAKNWSGRVSIDGGVLRQNGRSRETAVSGAAEAGRAVAGLVPLLEQHLVHPLLCFVREDELSGWARDVRVCSTSNVVAVLTAHPAALPADEVAQLCLDLDLGLREARQAVIVEAPASRRRASASRSRHLGFSTLARLAVGVALAGVLVFRPETLTGLAENISGLFVENVVDTSKPDPEKKQPQRPSDRHRGDGENRS
ncbi:MAG TPA: nuclease-related domain-containing protein [Trueperaceae bacterium]|nr:nuclease-related domain-containing protein [Trueperaceae bacterium]